MSDHMDSSKPAFPVADPIVESLNGLTAREYAAIKLRVPDSGTEWLDAMIRKSLRDDFAAKVLPAVYSNEKEFDFWCTEYSVEEAFDLSAKRAYELADAMLKARDA